MADFALAHFALSYGIGLVAVNREMSSDLVVPSVVHWQLNHYAAIVRQRGDYYEVVDPSTGAPMWLTEEEIHAEASGYFLVPAGELRPGWRLVGVDEADQIFGRGSNCPPEDPEDTPCCPGCPPGSGGNESGRMCP